MPKELVGPRPDRKSPNTPKPEGPHSVQVTGPEGARLLEDRGEAQSLAILKNMPVTGGEVFNPALEMSSLNTLEFTMDGLSVNAICNTDQQTKCPLVVDGNSVPAVELFTLLDTSSLKTGKEQKMQSGMHEHCLSLVGEENCDPPPPVGKGGNPQN